MSQSSPQSSDLQFAQALAAIDGDTELFLKLTEAFEDEATQLIDRLNEGMKIEDFAQVRRAAHSLMGPLQLFAATDLHTTAQTLENICQQQQAEYAASLVQQLSIGVGELQQSLREFVAKHEGAWSE